MGKWQSKLARNSSASSKYRAATYNEAERAPPTAAPKASPAHQEAVASVASLVPRLCVSGGKDKAVIVCSWCSGTVVRRFAGHEREVTKVCCLPESSWLFSASRDKTALMWDLHGGSEAARCFSGHRLVVTGLAVSSVFQKLCTGSRDNTVRLWDMETGRCLSRACVSRNLVTHLSWVPREPYVVQTSEDKTIRIWDSRGLQMACAFPAKKHIQTSCDVSLDGRYCISGSDGFDGEGCEATVRLTAEGSRCRARLRCMVGLVVQEHVRAANVFGRCSCPGGGADSSGLELHHPGKGTSAFPAIATASHDCTVKVWRQDTGACVAGLCPAGAGPLASLAACEDATLLCASSSPGIRLLQFHSARGWELREAASF
ncbi:WD repeat-containing protein 31 isoform X2 [Python bivittatus]|uniref:WD repeat-containing protein 31 isoform X2 n=1 Tax=Python bivittatus TaxID=176946 RepID=A0A9F5IWT7_PYTBI|nr:WD repeat-containing protein 31 isoform X2 [Python bivittatus]